MTKVKKWIVFISIVFIILGFCKYITMQQEIEYTDKIMLCVTFTGLFATFGGAYLGAKISGDNARKLFEIQQIYEKEERREQIIAQLTLSMNYIVKLIDKITTNFASNRKIYRYLYHRKNIILNKNYTAKIDREELKEIFNELIDRKEVKMIFVEDYIYENYIYFIELLNEIMTSKDIIYLDKEKQKQLFLFRQVVDTLSYMFDNDKSKGLYKINLNVIEKELAFVEYYVQLCVLLMDIQKWTILKDK